jgi:crotonobetainyl-CoA:carnitine CoA-transferase CaiB-like acyl-CoA transferase
MGELFASEHLKSRGFFATIEHPVAGTTHMPGAPNRMAATPGTMRSPAPLLGQHTAAVLANDLRMSPAQIDTLRREGVI